MLVYILNILKLHILYRFCRDYDQHGADIYVLLNGKHWAEREAQHTGQETSTVLALLIKQKVIGHKEREI